MKCLITCPVCGGTGAVDPSFGSGMPGNVEIIGGVPYRTFTSDAAAKTCPACGGSGMQMGEI